MSRGIVHLRQIVFQMVFGPFLTRCVITGIKGEPREELWSESVNPSWGVLGGGHFEGSDIPIDRVVRENVPEVV